MYPNEAQRNAANESHPAHPSTSHTGTTPSRTRARITEFAGGLAPLAGVEFDRRGVPAEADDPAASEFVVAVDFAASSLAATRHADRLARKEGASLRFLHVYDAPSATCRQGAASILEFHTIEQEARTRLEAFARSVDVDATCEFRIGDPAGVIMRRATECGAEGIVMGAHEHAGPGALGTVAREVRADASCPVLLVTETLERAT